MSLNLLDALFLSLIAGAFGLGLGWGLSAWVARRQSMPAPASDPSSIALAAERARNGTAAPRPAPAAPPPPAPAAPAQAADLLLVDDSAVARTKLRRLFETAGYQVHIASDGIEALALLDKGNYQMLITDLEMPNMDGVTLINTCLSRPQTARMPILAISGHESLRAKFTECREICGIHRKPWVDDILLSHVAALVGARTRRAPAAHAPHGAGQTA